MSKYPLSDRRRRQKMKELRHSLNEAELRADDAKREILELQAEEFIKIMEEEPPLLTPERQLEILAKGVAQMWASRLDHVPMSIHTMIVRVQQAGVDLQPYLEQATKERSDD